MGSRGCRRNKKKKQKRKQEQLKSLQQKRKTTQKKQKVKNKKRDCGDVPSNKILNRNIEPFLRNFIFKNY